MSAEHKSTSTSQLWFIVLCGMWVCFSGLGCVCEASADADVTLGSLWWEEAGACSDTCTWLRRWRNTRSFSALFHSPGMPSSPCLVSSLFMEESGSVTLCTCLRQERKSRYRDATPLQLEQSMCLLPGKLPRSLAAHLLFICVQPHTRRQSRSVSTDIPENVNWAVNIYGEKSLLCDSRMNKARVPALPEFIVGLRQ